MRLSFRTLCAAALLATPAVLPTFASGDTVEPTVFYAPTPPADASATFADPNAITRGLGTQNMLFLWYRGTDQPTMSEQMKGTSGDTWAFTLGRVADRIRAYYAGASGGKLDFNIDIIEVPLDHPDGKMWSSSEAQSVVLPTLGVDASQYKFFMNFYGQNTGSFISNPSSSNGAPGVSNGTQSWFWFTDSATTIHETGHMVGYGHAHRYKDIATQYTYDYATKQYVTTSGMGTSFIANLPIGNSYVEYGHPYSVMNSFAGDQGLSPRWKARNGWLEQKHFANVNKLTARSSDGVTRLRIYDDMADRDVVTNGLTGDALAYGVKNPYADVYYNATILRPGETFQTTDATHGKWVSSVQTLDFYYRSHADAYPGYTGFGNASAVVVDLNGIYLGRMAPGETFLEKDFSQTLSSVDVLAYNAGAPLNPERYRSVWYRISYLDNGEDAFGHYANLEFTMFSGAQVVGWQWDADPNTPGAQDGSGVWNTSADTRWRSVSLALDNQRWTSGEDASFGSGGAAGTVTVTGAVAANSIAFQPGGTGAYLLAKGTGGVISLGAGGIVAQGDARIEADVTLTESQIWNVSNNRTLDLAGTLTQGGSALTKMGQGTLLLSTARTWNGALNVVEGQVTQTATQTFSGSGSLTFGEMGEYNLNGGSLVLASGKSVDGAWGLMRLNSGGSDTAPELDFLGSSSVSPNLALSSGTHYIRNAGSVTLSGDISGAGDIAKLGAGALTLSGENSFTGALSATAGTVVLANIAATGAANDVALTGAGLRLDAPISGKTAVIGNLSGNAAATLSAVASGALAQRTLKITQSADNTFAGAISDGAGGYVLGLVKSGAAALTLSGQNTYTGTTVVEAGVLRAGSASAFGVNSAATVASGAALDLGGNAIALGSLAGAGAVTLGSGTLTVGASGASGAFSGAISGSGGLVKTGTGALTLSGQNTYAGATRAAGGELRLDFSASTLGADIVSSASALEIAGGDIVFVGRDGAAVTQTFAATSVTGGPSSLRIVRTGSGTVDVNLGAITRTAGTVDFSGSTGAAAGGRFLTTTGAAGAMLPGGAWATVNGVDWAAKDATNTYIVAFSNYLDIATGTGVILNSPTAAVRIVDGASGSVSLGASSVAINSLLMGAHTHDGVLAMAGKTLAVGAVSVASDARALTIGQTANEGELRGNAGALLLLSNIPAAAGALTVNSVIADTGATPLALAVSGGVNAGVVTLAGSNTYSGGTALTNDVTLRVGAGGSTGALGSGVVHLDSGTRLEFLRSDTALVANLLEGFGSVTQSGSGTLALTGANTYSGGTHVAGGTLRVGDGGSTGALGSGAVIVDSGATLEFRRSDAFSFANTLSGPGAFVKSGAGTLTLNSVNAAFTGAVSVNAGTLAVTAATGTGAASGFGSGANTLNVNTGGTLRFDTARAAGYHTGALNINGGTVTVNGSDNTLAAGATVTFDTAAGRVDGSGQWVARNAMATVVTAAASGSAIDVASLRLNGVTAGAYGFDVADGASAADLTINAVISGQTGGEAIRKTGAGTLRLTGANTYTGGSTVTAGTLLVSSGGNLGTGKLTLGSATLAVTSDGLRRTSIAGGALDTVTAATGTLITNDFSPLHSTTSGVVPNNATFAYTGRIRLTAGQWSFGEHYDDAAYLKIGDTVLLNNTGWNTPSSGSITIAADGWYDLDLRVWNSSGGGAMWSGMGIGIRQGGASTNAADYTRFANGALGVSLAAVGDITVANATELTGAAKVDTSALSDGSAFLLTGAVSGAGSLEKIGAGALVLSGTNTYSGATTVTAGTVRLDSATAFGGKGALAVASGATFDLAGYAAETAALSGAGSVTLGGAALTVNQAVATTFSGVVSGAGSLVKSGTGSLTLSGKNTYTGDTVVNAGALRLDLAATGGDPVVAASSRLVLAGGRLDVLGHATLETTQRFAATLVTTETAATVSLTSAGARVTLDLGALSRTGGGALDFVLDAAPAVNRITLSGFAAGQRLGEWATVNNGSAFAEMDATGTYVVASTGGFTAVDVHGGGSRTHVIPNAATDDVRIIQGGVTLTPVTLAATTTTVRSLIVTASDAAVVDFAAGQKLAVSGSSGVATIVHGGAAGALTLGTVANRGALTAAPGTSELILSAMNPSAEFTVKAALVDNGAALTLTKSGQGTLVLNATNTYSGATNIAAGTLRLDGAATLGGGAYAGAIANSGTLRYASSADQTLSGVISGAGSLVKDTAGSTLTLSGANTFSGPVVVSAGTLALSGVGSIGTASLTVNSGATFASGVSGVATLEGNTVVNGLLAVNSGTLRLGAAGTFSCPGSVAIASGATFDAANKSLTLGSISGGGALALGSGTLAVTSGNFSGGISGDLAGTPALTKTGAGELILSGANTFVGGAVVSSGKLTLSGSGVLGGGAYAGAVSIASGAEFNAGSDANQTLSGGISGAGLFTKSGAGTLTLSTTGATHTGGTVVNDGVLNLAAGGYALRGVVTVNTGGTLRLTSGDSLGYSANSSSVTTLNLVGGTLFAASGNQTTSATINLTGGTIAGTANIDLYNNTAAITTFASAAESLISVSTMNLRQSDTEFTIEDGAAARDLVVTSVLGDGAGGNHALIKLGAGTMVLTGTNTYSGATRISEGVISVATIGNGGVSSNLGKAASTASNLVLDGGTLRYTGVTASTDRAFSIGDGTTGTFEVSSADATLTVSGDVTASTGSLVKTGAGALTLSGNTAHTGATSVNEGRLTLNGANLASVTVAAGATLGGSGSTTGSLTFADGAALATAGVAFTASGGVTLAGALTVSYDIAPGAGTHTLLNYGQGFSGDLARISSTNARATFANNVAAKTIEATITTLTDTWNIGSGDWVNGGPPNWTNGAEGRFYSGDSVIFGDRGSATTVTLVGDLSPAVVTVSAAHDYTFSGAGRIVGATGLTKSGAGTLTLATAASVSGPITVSGGVLRTTGVFTTAGGAVAIAAGATFDTGGNALATSSLTGGGTLAIGGAALTVASGDFSGVVSGTGSLTKTGSGELILSGENTYTGATTVSAGKLTVSGRLGAGAYAGAIADNGSLEFSSASNQTLSGVISGTGTLIKSGAGTLTLSGSNVHTGTIAVNAGVLKLGRSNAFGAANASVSKVIVASGGTLDLNGVADGNYGVTITGSGSVGQGALVNTGANLNQGSIQLPNLKLAGDAALGGSGAISMIAASYGANSLDLGGNTLTKTGTNTFSLCNTTVSAGAIVIASGTLSQTGNASNASSASVSLANTAGATLALNNLNLSVGSLSGGGVTGGGVSLGNATLTVGALNTDTTYAGVVSGSGKLTKTGSGTLTLTGVETYTGVTTVSAGTLQIGDGVSTGSIATSAGITNNAALVFNNAAGAAYGNVISGTGTLTKAGAGTLTLSGTNTYSGATFANAGKLVFNGANASSVNVAAGATFGGAGATTGSLTFADGATYSATPGVFTASGGVTLQGALNVTYDTAPVAGTYTLLNYGSALAGDLAKITATNARAAFSNDTVAKTIVATISTLADTWNTGSGNWQNGGPANWTNGAEGRFYAGDSVTFGDRGAAATVTLVGDLAPASVTVSSANDYAFTGTGRIVGAAGLTKSGSGKLTLNTANTYTGATTINGGTLEIGADGRLGGGAYAGAITDNGALVVAANADQTLSGVISGSGSLTKSGAGTLLISRQATYSGATVVDGGVLSLSVGGASTGTLSGTPTITVNAGGTLLLGATDALGWTAGKGALVINSGGTVRMAAGKRATIANTITMTGGELTGVGPGDGTGNFSLYNGAGITATSDAAGNAAIISAEKLALQSSGGLNTFNVTRGVATPAADLLVTGAIVSWGSNGIGKTGDGVMTLTGDNTYTGATTVTAGTLVIGGAGRLGGGSYAQAVSNAGALVFSTSANQSLSGVVSGAGTLSKSGSGTLTLSGTNTYTGATTVSGGTLLAGNAKAFGTGAVTVNAGGTLNTGLNGTAYTLANAITVNSGGRLTGSGTLSGVVSFASGAVVAPGNSVETLTFASGATFASGSAYEWEVSGANLTSGYTAVAGVDYDRMLVTGGALNIGSGTVLKVIALNLDYANIYWSTNHTFAYATISGTSTTSGVFSLDATSAGNFGAYGNWSLAQNGSDLMTVWTAVPEPSTYGLLGAGALGLAALVRRRRRNAGQVCR